jgi:methyl-galactoside transport system substrate-binding protein
MKILRKIIVLILVILTFFTLTSVAQINGFAADSSKSVSNGKIAKIGVLLYSFDDPYMMEIKQNLENIQNENKAKVNFTFYDGKNNLSVQNEAINSLLSSNVDLLILKLVDTREEVIKDVINNIKGRNIPSIFMEVSPEVVSKVAPLYNKAFFLYSTSSHEGKLQGKIIADAWNANKSSIDKNGDNILQYVLLKGEATNPYTVERSNDVISAINEAGIKTEQLSQINANWSMDLARTSIENLFLKYDGKIEAIISNNDAMAVGAIEALQKYGYNTGDKTKNIAVVGIDGLKEAKDLIDKGLMTGTLIQNSKMVAETFYKIGMNLVNNVSPIENTHYTLNNGIITVPESYEIYTNQTATP